MNRRIHPHGIVSARRSSISPERILRRAEADVAATATEDGDSPQVPTPSGYSELDEAGKAFVAAIVRVAVASALGQQRERDQNKIGEQNG